MHVQGSGGFGVEVARLTDEAQLTVHDVVVDSVRVDVFEYFHAFTVHASEHGSQVVVRNFVMVKLLEELECFAAEATRKIVCYSLGFNWRLLRIHENLALLAIAQV